MGKVIWILTFIYILMTATCLGDVTIRDKLTARYYSDVNGDGRKELLIHDFYGGSAGFGELRIYTSGNICIFSKSVEGDPYLWHPEKHIPALNPGFFPDLDKDGIVEILVGYRGKCNRVSHVDEPWWFDVYKWDGKTYVLANDQFPGFYKKKLAYYESFVKKNGEHELIREFINRAKKIAREEN